MNDEKELYNEKKKNEIELAKARGANFYDEKNINNEVEENVEDVSVSLENEAELEGNEELVEPRESDYSEEQDEYQEEFAEEENEELREYVRSIYKEECSKNNLKTFLLVLTAFSLGGLSVFGMQSAFSKQAVGSRVAAIVQEDSNQETTINSISKAKDAVVSVVNYQSTSKNSKLDSILGKNSSNGTLQAVSNGSGVIYKKDGNTAYIITNEHVIKGAEKLNVILSDGTSVSAEIVGSDIWADLAVLKISGENVKVVMDFADSDKVAVGETSLAIGSPLGVSLSNTVTKGIISAVDRQIPIDIDKDGTYDWYQTVIQTDTAINPGNSGGALINNSGELIGINQLKIAATSRDDVAAEGIGFVIPANEVKLITEQLEKNGKVVRPAMGVQIVSIETLNSELVSGTLNYDANNKGVVIKSVEEGSAAAKAGLKEYDVITKFNDYSVANVAEVRKYLFEKTKIGDVVTITYYRDGKEYATKLILGALG